MTNKILTRIEWLKEVGYENYSEEKYQEYLSIMKNQSIVNSVLIGR